MFWIGVVIRLGLGVSALVISGNLFLAAFFFVFYASPPCGRLRPDRGSRGGRCRDMAAGAGGEVAARSLEAGGTLSEQSRNRGVWGAGRGLEY